MINIVLLASLVVLAPPAAPAPSDSGLIAEYRSVLEAKFLRRDSGPLARLTDTSYVVVTPGGLLESRTVAIRGVQNFRLDSIALSDVRVHRTGGIAILTAELRLAGALEGRTSDGTTRRVDLTGAYRVLATFVDTPGTSLRLVAESVTPVRPQGMVLPGARVP